MGNIITKVTTNNIPLDESNVSDITICDVSKICKIVKLFVKRRFVYISSPNPGSKREISGCVIATKVLRNAEKLVQL